MEITRQHTPLILNALKYNISSWIATGHHLSYLDDSYTDFHAPGVNYLCLSRTPRLTIKLYELPPTDGKQIVSPHNHAYNFDSVLLDGCVSNITYYELEEDDRESYDQIVYKRTFRSKLNCGSGFATESIKCRIALRRGQAYMYKYDHYYTSTEDIHTLIVREPSLLFISQYEDIKTETSVYTNTPESPSLEGLYKKMTKEKAYQLLTKALSVL